MLLKDYETINIDNKDYVKICKSENLLEGKGMKVQFPDDFDMQVAVFRINNNLYCVSNICPHKHQPVLYKGLIKKCTVTCPAHGWTYDLKSGKNTNRNAGIKQLKKYDIFQKDGFIYIEKPELNIPKWRQND